RVRLVGLVLAVFALAVGGIAYASINSGDVIHACYKKSTPNQGSLRVIDADTQTCNNNESALDWNRIGPPDPPGTTGSSDGWDAQLTGTVSPGGADVRLSNTLTGLPPGSYLIGGAATWPPLDSGSAFLFCNVIASGADVTGSTTGGFGTASDVGG